MKIKYTYSAGESFESLHHHGECVVEGKDLLDCNNKFFAGFNNECGFIRVVLQEEVE